MCVCVCVCEWNVNNLYSVTATVFQFFFHLSLSLVHISLEFYEWCEILQSFFLPFFQLNDATDNALNMVFGFQVLNERILFSKPKTENYFIIAFVFQAQFIVQWIHSCPLNPIHWRKEKKSREKKNSRNHTMCDIDFVNVPDCL